MRGLLRISCLKTFTLIPRKYRAESEASQDNLVLKVVFQFFVLPDDFQRLIQDNFFFLTG